MKKLGICILLALWIIGAKAESVKVDNLYYNLFEETLTASVTYNFDTPDENDRFNYMHLPSEIVIPSTIVVDNKTYTVTSIGQQAFISCDQLESVSLPSTLVTIGSEAFSYTGLKTIVIPENVESIGISAFSGCHNLTEIELPSALSKIGSSAFSHTGLTTISLPEGITDIPENAFFYADLENIILPSTITTIGSSAFSDCKNLKEIIFPESLETIGKQAFKDCIALESLYLNKVNSIGEKAFEDCLGISNIDFGTGSLIIGSEAFAECTGLSEITIPETVVEIGYMAFYDCMGIKDINISDGTSPILLAHAPFANCPVTDLYVGRDITGDKWNDYFTSNKQLEKVVLGDEVTTLPNRMFYYCKSIKEITFGDHIKTVKNDAFTKCDNLKRVNCKSIDEWAEINFESTSSNPLTNGADLFVDDQLVTDIVFSDNISAIGDNAFICYKPLKSVTLSKSITSVGEQAFFGCENLEKVSIEANSINYGYGAFLRCENIREVYCDNISDWLLSKFETGPANPLYYGAKLYVDGELLTTLDVPEGITQINENSFFNYPYLTKVTLPESVTEVGTSAFVNCEDIEEIILGSHIQNLGNRAFNGTNLKTIISKATTPPAFSLYPTIATFSDYTADVFVPFGSAKAYRENEYWKNFSTIEESDLAGIDSISNESPTPFSINGGTVTAITPLKIYTFNGIQIGTMESNTDQTLPDGIYLIKSINRTYKVKITNH
ncbi:MAG: leucine-rich repeat domain-containing protein [Muribaculaceae bacterium]|nr:leucine-rich repeat domain-containing protein [Muribaculaceae bacterium]